MDYLKALLFGILEGITEWLPVSSTGHLILLERFLSFSVEAGGGAEAQTLFREAFLETFDVVIQLGAIFAVVLRYFDRLFPFLCKNRDRNIPQKKNALSLYLKIILSGIPVAAIGVLGDALLERLTGRDIDGWIYSSTVVAMMLILYGVVFLFPDRYLPRLSRSREECQTVDSVSYGNAFLIGCFEALSIVPGTSRSGVTILGGRMLGLSRSAATEYSFLLAVPTMLGASLLKLWQFFRLMSTYSVAVPMRAYLILLVGTVTAFAVSLLTIDFLTSCVRKHSFRAFGIYRICLGVLVLLFAV